MDAEIVPEPTEAEREALLRALAEAEGADPAAAAYDSPWWQAGLPGEEDPGP